MVKKRKNVRYQMVFSVKLYKEVNHRTKRRNGSVQRERKNKKNFSVDPW